MSVLNEIFDKVFVLTIERNADRHGLVREQLSGVDFEFWYGTDIPVIFPEAASVSQIPNAFFTENNIDKNYVSAWTKGQLGAYSSITKMISEVEKKYERVLLFEDDFIPLRQNWQTIMKQALEELPPDWDVLLAGYLYYGKAYQLAYDRKYRWLFNVYNTWKKIMGIRGSINVVPRKYSAQVDNAGAALGGHAYCLSKKGAGILMSHLNPMRKSGDELVHKLIDEKKIKAFAVYPCLFLQNDEFESKTKITGI